MSTDDIQEIELNELVKDLNKDAEERLEQEGMLDIKKVMTEQIELSKKLKTMRTELKAKKFAVEKALLIVETRLAMSLEMIKTMQLPMK